MLCIDEIDFQKKIITNSGMCNTGLYIIDLKTNDYVK